jgi:hypothetical protein
MNDLAVVYKYAGHDDDAEALYRRALAAIEATVGTDHVEAATMLQYRPDLLGSGTADEGPGLGEDRALHLGRIHHRADDEEDEREQRREREERCVGERGGHRRAAVAEELVDAAPDEPEWLADR